jgi:large subunit ribosomal protein L19
MYDLYSPVLQKIEVLKLEKRLDDELLYLRDAPAEYSSFPSDLAPIALPSDRTVPINCMKVRITQCNSGVTRLDVNRFVVSIVGIV